MLSFGRQVEGVVLTLLAATAQFDAAFGRGLGVQFEQVLGIGPLRAPIGSGRQAFARRRFQRGLLAASGKEGGTDQMVSQTNLRHIMLVANEIRTDEQPRAAIEELRQKIVAGDNFATLARQNSDDASSVVGGGDLDWINDGGMPPEMQAVVDTMEIGELSEPFKTETGWHITEVLGRRIQDLSRDYTHNQAENALRDRKFDLELENWLIEIREKAFVVLID